MDSEIKGLDELSRKLNDLAQRAERLDGPHEVPLSQLLNPTFLKACSRFSSVDEMFQASGFKIESGEDFKSIPEGEWNTFVKTNTSFDGWTQMLESASADWTKKQLGLE